MCVGKGVTIDDPKADSHYTDELYLRSADEMRAVMAHYPDAVENTLKVAEMCEVAPARACEHLRLMKGRGMLTAERRGHNVYYRIASPQLPGLLECVRKHCKKD